MALASCRVPFSSAALTPSPVSWSKNADELMTVATLVSMNFNPATFM